MSLILNSNSVFVKFVKIQIQICLSAPVDYLLVYVYKPDKKYSCFKDAVYEK